MYRSAHAMILVYDATSQRSFDRIEDLLQEVELFYPDSTLKALIGNKTDLSDKRIISEDEEKDLLKNWACLSLRPVQRIQATLRILFKN
jgi:GTPase SAR1 family protein